MVDDERLKTLGRVFVRYAYVYGDRIRAGISSSPVQIETEVRGERETPIPQDFPAVAFRIGIDLSPIDLTDAVYEGPQIRGCGSRAQH